jgi:hypothetical protein
VNFKANDCATTTLESSDANKDANFPTKKKSSVDVSAIIEKI